VSGFTYTDILASLIFLLAWSAYSASLDHFERVGISLNRLMNVCRHDWADQLGVRENRVVDILINTSLLNGTAFFASTSLLALGGVLSFSYATDTMLTVFSGFIIEGSIDRTIWCVKIIGLALIFIYAFLKFSWSYRLFYYVAILMGAVPDSANGSMDIERAVHRVAIVNAEAGLHFNRGLQAFFFALAYLGWFLGPYVFMATTAFVLFVMFRRQFASDARRALTDA
jgi:uncharacterized membrane protein